ncbi:MAG TPA: helix-turn-helix domain-containing protein [Candidatus Thermoplasmatota archaeon]|nr:helix-turn-helix domain-containing protein [Candidatus Thermoplasmatota archaeon]
MNPERLKRLMGFGLTEYEARAYSALLELEVATAGKLAELARVPRTKIYGALEGLAEKQLVQLVPERPMRYVALPFTDYVARVHATLRARSDEIEAAKEEIAREFTPKGNIRMEEDGGFIVFRGRSNVTSKLFDMITQSKRGFLLMATENSSRRVDYHMAMVRDRAAQGVQFRLLCPTGPKNAEVLAAFGAQGEVRRALEETPGCALAILDDREALVMHFLPDDDHHFQGSDVALWTDDKAMVLTLKAMLEAQWQGAETVHAPAKPLHVDLAPALVEA